MPQMGVSVSEGTITKWLKQVGEEIEADESLLEISTDKVDTEVPSPASGVVSEILVQEGETVEVGTLLARVGGEVGGSAPAPDAASPPPAQRAPEPATQAAADAANAAASEGVDVGDATEQPLAAPTETTGDSRSAGNGKAFVSPVVARIASEHGIDPNQVQGTGRGGRVTKKDILAFVEGGGAVSPPAETAPAAPAPAPAPAQAAPAPAPAPPKPAPQPVAAGEPAPAQGAPGETFEPVTAMRRGIAEHMRRSLDTSAHVTSAIEVDMSKVVAIRAKLKKEYEAAYGVNPTYLSFIAR